MAQLMSSMKAVVVLKTTAPTSPRLSRGHHRLPSATSCSQPSHKHFPLPSSRIVVSIPNVAVAAVWYGAYAPTAAAEHWGLGLRVSNNGVIPGRYDFDRDMDPGTCVARGSLCLNAGRFS